MFVFAFMLDWTSVGDVISLQWKHINFEDSKLSKVIRKTGTCIASG